ncbi:MAG: GAF domain-containing sensor histidine kinase [Chloroflexi bacterium]|nr:GAF domain-containing sensor histidine kinase [Chloroflexota bacterium]
MADAEQQIEDYRKILEITKHLNSTLEYRTLLQQIVLAVVDVIKVEACSILLIDPSTGELRFEIASNLRPQETEKIIVPMDRSIAGWIASHGEPRVIEDVTKEPIHFRGIDKDIKFETRNLLGVPLKTHTRVIGVVQAVNKIGGRFSGEDINLLTILASQASVAIENARLFMQSDFISEMVHELRTPLAALKASVNLLKRPNLPEDKRDEVHNLLASETDRLISLTSDFLDLARLESGRAEIERDVVDLYPLIRECLTIVEPQAAGREIEINLDVPESAVVGDKGKIKQVVLNLLTNAIKYNRPRGLVKVTAHSADNGMVQVDVADTGDGISADNLPNMFRKFFRAADHANRVQGTGLEACHLPDDHRGARRKHLGEQHAGQRLDLLVYGSRGVTSSRIFNAPGRAACSKAISASCSG